MYPTLRPAAPYALEKVLSTTRFEYSEILFIMLCLFVNSIYASKGGKHIDYIMNQIVDGVKKMLKKKTSSSSIKNRIRLFLNAKVINPAFSSQTKDELVTQQLVNDISKQTLQSITVLNLDATKFYDRIFPAFATLTMARMGAPIK
jgi:DNA gyrase/topoisomerase IV subunit B